MVSGKLVEAVFQLLGTPFSLAMFSSDIARTNDDTPMTANIRKEIQAIVRETAQIWCFQIFFAVLLVAMVLFY